jgi:hypothetical protein
MTKTEENLLWRLEHGYQLETDPLGSGLLLRNLEDNLVVRAASANQRTIKALEERGLIHGEYGRTDHDLAREEEDGKVKRNCCGPETPAARFP